MKDVFRSLKTRNYRLYFKGQVVSLIGTWMQITANSWLIFTLSHHSGVAVGFGTALQFGPMLIAGTWGGLIADRFPKLRTLQITQSLFLVQALALGVLTAGHWAELWMAYVLTFLYGCVQVIDVPTRQSFVSEMVRDTEVMNAIGLNSAVFNCARMVGPAVAGFLIAKGSMSVCFFVNAATYVSIIIALAFMRETDLYRHEEPLPEGPGQIRAGLRYVRTHQGLFLPLVMMAIVGTFGFNFQTVTPLLARFTFHGGADTFGLLSVVMAAGSAVGAMYAATRRIPSTKLLMWSCIAFGIVEGGAALVPTLHSAYIYLPLVGLTAMLFISTSNTVMQVRSSPEMRGRVLALWSLVFLGSTPIGGPLVGWISQQWSPRWAFAVGGIATALAGIVIGPMLLKHRAPMIELRVEEHAETVEAAS